MTKSIRSVWTALALSLVLGLVACSEDRDSVTGLQDSTGFTQQTLDPAMNSTASSGSFGPQLDILPRRDGNNISLRRRGQLRMALVGSESFDVRDVRRNSVRLDALRPNKIRVRDVTGPGGGGGELVSVMRINAGGPELAGTPVWLGDADFASSEYANIGFAATTSEAIDMGHPSIPTGTPMAVFQTERYDNSGLPDMQWEIPVADGSYAVRLYFADTYPAAHTVGGRVFDVSLEGQVERTGYDIFARAGGFAGVVEEISTVVNDGSVSIGFGPIAQNPTISAIELLRASAGTDGPRQRDDIDDLHLRFDKSSVMRALGRVEDGDVVELTITGLLRDGTPFSCSDTMTFRARGGDDCPDNDDDD